MDKAMNAYSCHGEARSVVAIPLNYRPRKEGLALATRVSLGDRWRLRQRMDRCASRNAERNTARGFRASLSPGLSGDGLIRHFGDIGGWQHHKPGAGPVGEML